MFRKGIQIEGLQRSTIRSEQVPET
jgi:hypothetical protein